MFSEEHYLDHGWPDITYFHLVCDSVNWEKERARVQISTEFSIACIGNKGANGGSGGHYHLQMISTLSWDPDLCWINLVLVTLTTCSLLECHPAKCRVTRVTLTPADHLSPSDNPYNYSPPVSKSCGFLRTDPVVGCLPGLAQKIFGEFNEPF